jgi:hypothetical protein
MDASPLHTIRLFAACLLQQSLTDEAICDLTLNLAAVQNWVAGAGFHPVV